MSDRGSLAFVFGGGGSRGACQVGMLSGLVDMGLVPDFVLGVSVGALNAAMFATDPTSRGVLRLKDLWVSAPLQELFPRNKTMRFLMNREAVYPAGPLRELISTNLAITNLAETKIPLHVLLADVDSGSEAWFQDGPLVDLLYGSAAIPGVLPPLRFNGCRYIDGGMVNPNPVQRAVELGASRIVLLLCGSLTPYFHSKGRPLATLLMGYSLTQHALTKVALASVPSSVRVTVIECGAADGIDALDFQHTDALIEAGFRSVRSHELQIKELTLDDNRLL